MKTSNKHQNKLAIYLALGLMLFTNNSQSQSVKNITRTSSFEYDAAGAIFKEIIEPSNPSLCIVNDFGSLDAYGHRTTNTARNCAGYGLESSGPSNTSNDYFLPRTSNVIYDSSGLFPIKVTNPFGQSEERTYDPTLGLMTSSKDSNGLITSWVYDALGRKVLERRPDGNGTRWKYENCTSISGTAALCPTVPAGVVGGSDVIPTYVITTTPVRAAVVAMTITSTSDNLSSSADGGDGGANGIYTKRYYDNLGRVIRIETQGYDSIGNIKLIYQDTVYNKRGLILGLSRPYYQDATTTYWWTYTYDNFNRVLTETPPDGGKISTSYQGLTTIVTNVKGQTLKEERNVVGLVISSTDNNGKKLTKTYDAQGNLLTTTDALGNVTSLDYDIKGRKRKMVDPDMGAWSYEYNALGELKSQTDGKAQVTTITYDVLGRMTQKSDSTLVSNWFYDKTKAGDSCGLSVGRLCEVTSNNTYDRRYHYDTLGRTDATQTQIGAATYPFLYSYTQDGQLSVTQYPTGLQIQNIYTSLGYLQFVGSATFGGASLYWRADSTDAEGHLTQQTFGNQVVTLNGYDPNSGRLTSTLSGKGSSAYVQQVSYHYDVLGNLDTLNDQAAMSSSLYGYDELNRLHTETRIGISVQSPQVITWDFDEIGNIKSRSDTGLTYVYGGARPHAITSVTGNINGIGQVNYFYDNNGSLSTASGTGFSRTLAWTGANKVQAISQTQSANTNVVQFQYDPFGDRAQETLTQNGVLLRTTNYLNPGNGAGLLYEEEIAPTSTKKKHYLNAGGITFGVLIYDTATKVWAQQYWHKDSLGSTVVVTDSMGSVAERFAYEPFGKRRNTDETTDLLGTLKAQTTRRGFTGHEMIEEIGLINMNGRIYDPAISKFLSADPTIQSANNMQNYNRYSYLMNNPTRGTDPSGYEIQELNDSQLRAVNPYDLGYSPNPSISFSSSCSCNISIGGRGGDVKLPNSAIPNNQKIESQKQNTLLPQVSLDGLTFSRGGNLYVNSKDDTGGFRQFLSELDPAGYAMQLGRKLLDDFVRNNQPGSSDSNSYLKWLAGMVDGAYSRPDPTSANGVLATVTAAALPFVTGKAEITLAKEPGAIMRVSESMSPRSAAYQFYAAGTDAGLAYVVNGVKFDGYMNGMLIDAKSGYAQFVKNGQFQPWFEGATSFVEQAQRQISVANGTPIQWRFMEDTAANATRSLFQQFGITGIDVLHFPF